MNKLKKRAEGDSQHGFVLALVIIVVVIIIAVLLMLGWQKGGLGILKSLFG